MPLKLNADNSSRYVWVILVLTAFKRQFSQFSHICNASGFELKYIVISRGVLFTKYFSYYFCLSGVEILTDANEIVSRRYIFPSPNWLITCNALNEVQNCLHVLKDF